MYTERMASILWVSRTKVEITVKLTKEIMAGLDELKESTAC